MLLRHTFTYFLSKAAPAIITMLSVIVFTRIATPEQYGTYSLITVIVGLANILIFQWLRSSLLRFYNERYENPLLLETIFKTHIYILISLIPIFLIISLFFSRMKLNFSFILIMYVMLALVSLVELATIYHRANLRPQTILKNNIITKIVFVLLATFLLYKGLGVWGLIIGGISSSLLGLYLYTKKIKLNTSKIKINKNTQKKMLLYGLPITFSFVLSVALQNIDKIMISYILGVEQNGNYSVSYDLIHNLLYMIMTSFALAGFPIVLKTIKEKGNSSGKKEFEKYAELLLLISIPATIGLIAIAPNLINIVIGNDYTIPEHLINLIIIATFFHGMKSHYYDQGLQISGKTKSFFIPALVAIIVNIILNFYLLSTYGIEGAAFATLIAFLLALILSGVYSKKNYKVKFPFKTLIKIVLSTSLMYVFIIQINLNSDIVNMIIKIILGIIIYFLSIIVLNTMNIRIKIKNKLGRIK